MLLCVRLDIHNCAFEHIWIFSEVAQPTIARVTKQATNSSGSVVMIHSKYARNWALSVVSSNHRSERLARNPTDRTTGLLSGKQSIIVGLGYTVGALEFLVPCFLGSTILTGVGYSPYTSFVRH